MTKIVLCMKWGTKYGPEYVNRLNSMISRNISGEHELICMTDDPTGIDSAIVTTALPDLGCATPTNTRGKWLKVGIWGLESIAGRTGPALFLDLDSIIVDNIDCYFNIGKPDDIILERNWARPLSRLGQTSVFRFQIGNHVEILKTFQNRPQAIADRYQYEQHYITSAVQSSMMFWPQGWTRHFRLHCLGPMPIRLFRPANIPRDVKIITFPGGPNPAEARLGKWTISSPEYQGRRAHFKHTLKTGNWKNFRRFIMPVDWIEEYWH